MRIDKSADLARIVQTRRQSRGLSQQEVAEATGMTRQSLARIERGNGGVSFAAALRIFEFLGITLDAEDAERKMDLGESGLPVRTRGHGALPGHPPSPVSLGNTRAAVKQWRALLDAQTRETQVRAAQVGTEVSAAAAQRALLLAIIEDQRPEGRSGRGVAPAGRHGYRPDPADG